MADSKSPGAAVAMAEKKRQALELRKAGVSYSEIARQIGYANKGSAHHIVMDALREVIEAPAKETLAEELARLDGMLMAFYPKAKAGNDKAAAMVLRIMDRRAKYLGLDQPEQIQSTVEIRYEVVGINPDVYS